MAQIASPPPQETQDTPFWRTILGILFDVRFLGVLGQIGFILLVVLGARAIGGNFAENASRLGEAQFICRDGSFSYRCAYDFMSSEAGFDIADIPIDYVNTDPYWRAFQIGVINTLKVAILGIAYTGDLKVHVLSPGIPIARMLKKKGIDVKEIVDFVDISILFPCCFHIRRTAYFPREKSIKKETAF